MPERGRVTVMTQLHTIFIVWMFLLISCLFRGLKKTHLLVKVVLELPELTVRVKQSLIKDKGSS